MTLAITTTTYPWRFHLNFSTLWQIVLEDCCLQYFKMPPWWPFWISGLEVIKLECSLKLKIKRNDWLLADTCPQARVRKQSIIALYFEFENELKFYNLGAWKEHFKQFWISFLPQWPTQEYSVHCDTLLRHECRLKNFMMVILGIGMVRFEHFWIFIFVLMPHTKFWFNDLRWVVFRRIHRWVLSRSGILKQNYFSISNLNVTQVSVKLAIEFRYQNHNAPLKLSKT